MISTQKFCTMWRESDKHKNQSQQNINFSKNQKITGNQRESPVEPLGMLGSR